MENIEKWWFSTAMLVLQRVSQIDPFPPNTNPPKLAPWAAIRVPSQVAPATSSAWSRNRLCRFPQGWVAGLPQKDGYSTCPDVVWHNAIPSQGKDDPHPGAFQSRKSKRIYRFIKHYWPQTKSQQKTIPKKRTAKKPWHCSTYPGHLFPQ